MNRGDLWTLAGGSDYSGKARPAVILQDDQFDATDSITVCLLTTDPSDMPLFRIRVEPDDTNGPDAVSRIMVDKVTTVRKSRLGSRIGQLGAEDIVRLDRAVLVFLGLAA